MHHITTITEAKAQLSALIARVEKGEEIIIGRAGKPVAKLTACDIPPRKRAIPGALKGKIWMADDFDEWPEDIAIALGIIDGPEDETSDDKR